MQKLALFYLPATEMPQKASGNEEAQGCQRGKHGGDVESSGFFGNSVVSEGVLLRQTREGVFS